MDAIESSSEPRKDSKLFGWRAEILAAVALVAYSVVRTVAVAMGISARDHAVSWRIFLLVELATTPPYVYGMGSLARNAVGKLGKRDPNLVIAFILAIGSLLGPYLYIGIQGRGMPTTVWIVTTAVVVLCLIGPGRKLVRFLRSGK